MKITLAAFLLLWGSFVSGDSSQDLVREEWNLFKVQHNKKYGGSIEEGYRFKIFVENLKKIYQHNQKYELGETSYKMSVNEFTDMFEHEVIETMCGINGTELSLSLNTGAFFIPPENVKLPREFDWRRLGAVTGVKNQGHCGSCWAFSSTGALEGQNFRRTKTLMSLSEQNLMDCSWNYGNKGCKGGWMGNAFQYVQKNNGIDTEQSYPYEGVDHKQCKYTPRSKGTTIKGYTQISPRREDLLLNAVASIGPISVAIEVTSKFYSYREGVFSDPSCSKLPSAVNHGVLVVGYGVDNATSMEYWLVKNSWGAEWGDKGYIKMVRNRNNNCNIATFGIYPLE